MTELDKKLDKILDDFSTWDKCGNFECQHYLNYLDSIDQLKSLIKEVVDEVIKSKEMVFSDIIPTFNSLEEYIEHVAKIREVQRAEQRTKLNEVLK